MTMEVTRINTRNDKFVVVTVGFQVTHEDSTTSSGTIEVQLDGQDYSLDELKKQATFKTAQALARVLADHSVSAHQ